MVSGQGVDPVAVCPFFVLAVLAIVSYETLEPAWYLGKVLIQWLFVLSSCLRSWPLCHTKPWSLVSGKGVDSVAVCPFFVLSVLAKVSHETLDFAWYMIAVSDIGKLSKLWL